MHIRRDDLTDPRVHALLHEHLRGAVAHSPAGNVFALGLDALRQPDITVWSAWDGEDLLGVGALRQLDAAHGELKSMRTASSHLRRGVARALVLAILDEARRRGVRRVSLETGGTASFEPARRLYASLGFVPCARFGDYPDNGFSVFMTRAVEPPPD